MTAMRAAGWYMGMVAWAMLAWLATWMTTRPGWAPWLELAGSYAVTWPLIGGWRRAS